MHDTADATPCGTTKVLAAVREIKKVIEGVAREKRPTLNYEIVSYDTLLEFIRDHTIANGLDLIPVDVVHLATSPFQASRKTGPVHMNMTSYIFRFRLYHESGEFLPVAVPADGIDEGDKGPGKAMTYASKQAWLQVLMLKRGKEFDLDEVPSADLAKAPHERAPAATPEARPAAAATSKATTPATPEPGSPAEQAQFKAWLLPQLVRHGIEPEKVTVDAVLGDWRDTWESLKTTMQGARIPERLHKMAEAILRYQWFRCHVVAAGPYAATLAALREDVYNCKILGTEAKTKLLQEIDKILKDEIPF